MSQPIGPETTIGALLEAYPELEDVLVEMAPAFAKLRNPIVRRTVAKVATLEQAAKIGGISLQAMILRRNCRSCSRNRMWMVMMHPG